MIGQKGIPAQSGGIENHVEHLSKNLAEQGHSVSIYSRAWYCKGQKFNQKNITRIFTPTINTKHLDAITHTFFSSISALFKDFDVIHYHGVGPSLLAWIPRLFSNKKVISTFHCIDRKHGKWGVIAQLTLFLGELASCVFPHETIVVSKEVKRYCKEKYNIKTKYIPNGVPLFLKAKSKNKLEKWNLKENNYLLVVSRLISHKGIHYAINAFQEIKNKIDEKLVIVGGAHQKSNYPEKLKEAAKDEDNIIFTGFQSGKELKQLFSYAKLLIAPSDHEGLPITVLEGMSYKLPIVASNISPHKSLIESNKFLFEKSNSDKLSQILESILNKDSQLKQVGEKNRRKIEEKFSWDNIASQVEAVYS